MDGYIVASHFDNDNDEELKLLISIDFYNNCAPKSIYFKKELFFIWLSLWTDDDDEKDEKDIKRDEHRITKRIRWNKFGKENNNKNLRPKSEQPTVVKRDK